ncbi:hypothetical protein P3S67_007125 [Capsicum chacoense]
MVSEGNTNPNSLREESEIAHDSLFKSFPQRHHTKFPFLQMTHGISLLSLSKFSSAKMLNDTVYFKTFTAGVHFFGSIFAAYRVQYT